MAAGEHNIDDLKERLKRTPKGSKAHNKLKEHIKRVENYDAGRSERVKENFHSSHRAHSGESFADQYARERGWGDDWADATRKQTQHATQSVHEWYDPKDRRSMHFKKRKGKYGDDGDFTGYHEARKDQRTWTGGHAATLGDRRRARHQKWGLKGHHLGNKARDIDSNLQKHKQKIRVASYFGGLGTFVAGTYYSQHQMNQESKTNWRNQHGAASDKHRNKIRRGETAAIAGYGAWAGTLMGGGPKVAIGSAVAGAAVGNIAARKFIPKNKMTSKQWVVYTRKGANGQVKRVKRKNPYYGKAGKKRA